MKFLSPTIKGYKFYLSASYCWSCWEKNSLISGFLLCEPWAQTWYAVCTSLLCVHGCTFCFDMSCSCYLLYSQKIWRGIKFGGLKPPTCNDVTRNADIMHTVALLALSSATLHKHFARSVTNNISRFLLIYCTLYNDDHLKLWDNRLHKMYL